MKYIKIFFGLFIAAWLVTIVMGGRIKPDSLFYPVRVYVNEPLWIWIHITAPGRAATLQSLLDVRYRDLEHAWFARDQKQALAAQIALQHTGELITVALQDYITAGDYKVADTLASFSISMAQIHGRVLEALVVHGGVTQTPADVAFTKDTVQTLQTLRSDESKKFVTVYAKEDLVRGIDAQLNGTRGLQEQVQAELYAADSLLQPEQRTILENILIETQTGYVDARNKLGLDQYAESFVLTNTVRGRLHEVRVAIRATKEFGLAITPAIDEVLLK